MEKLEGSVDADENALIIFTEIRNAIYMGTRKELSEKHFQILHEIEGKLRYEIRKMEEE